MEQKNRTGITGSKSKIFAEFFFYLGLLGALGLRLVLILTHINILYARISWYFAMITLIVFYYFRLWIENKRREIIVNGDLLEKVERNELNDEDREKVRVLLSSVMVSKLRLNFLILFLMSIVALLVEIVIDFGDLL